MSAVGHVSVAEICPQAQDRFRDDKHGGVAVALRHRGDRLASVTSDEPPKTKRSQMRRLRETNAMRRQR